MKRLIEMQIESCDKCPFRLHEWRFCLKTEKDVPINSEGIPIWCPLPKVEE